MNYAPHILQHQRAVELERDSNGRVLAPATAGCWQHVCRCRRDHAGDKDITTADGRVARPSWKVVCEGHPRLITGHKYRVLDDGGNVIAEGYALDTKNLNYLEYAEVYL
ncbi:MAG: hypothetical protein LIP02_03925 [Bacteroidales bacterium]|nr:hypothetical protein [Bacteroidales bacterium]